MKLSSRSRYATRALLDLALHYGEGPLPLKEISRRQQISQQYLEHLITPLIAGGLVSSTRGARGGVWLAKPPAEIKLLDIFRLVEGPLVLVECLSKPETCQRAPSCATRDVWEEMMQAMNGVLEATTLQDLVERQQEKTRGGERMYHI
ncbi:MAG: Rrf2 family transcriptional regulator [Chloroflexota bacterium]